MKMKFLYRLYLVSFAALILLAELGCKKQLDINFDPNNPSPSQGTVKIVFPSAVLATIGKTGGDLEILGAIWSEFVTQSSGANQYNLVDSYNLINTNGFVNAPFDIMYTEGLKNYQYVMDKASADGDWNTYLMATVMKAYTVEVLVDLYDKVPYSEALEGAGNLNPKFDNGDSIYTALIASIDTALTKDFTVSTNTDIGSADLIFGGDMPSWIAFANTLKLKMYLRMVNAHPTIAQTGVATVYPAGPFLTADAAVTNFTNNPGLDNPLYEQNIRSLNTAVNLRASETFISWLDSNSDTRISAFFTPAATGHPLTGINQGDYSNNDTANQKAAIFTETALDPVEIISLPESDFLQAEADVRYNGSANAKTLYDAGVMAAFAQVGQDGSAYIAPGGKYDFLQYTTDAEKIQAIITQKWASCAYGCHAIESFFEKQRTGYPLTSPVYSTDPAYIDGQIVVSKGSVLTPGLLPRRLVFPYDETSRNTNAPALVPITTGVWWAQ